MEHFDVFRDCCIVQQAALFSNVPVMKTSLCVEWFLSQGRLPRLQSKGDWSWSDTFLKIDVKALFDENGQKLKMVKIHHGVDYVQASSINCTTASSP